MKLNLFKKNKNVKNMDPKDKDMKEELEIESSQNMAGEECQEQETANEETQETVDALSREEELEKEITGLNEQIEDQKDKYLRLSAEFDNYRKRTIKEKAELILNGSEKSILSFLPVVDDMERAIKTMESSTDVKALREGVELIYHKFISVLSQNGVKIIEAHDKPLDTDYHEAIAVIPAPNEELKGKVLDCVQTGYTMNDKVIRHAKVVVGE